MNILGKELSEKQILKSQSSPGKILSTRPSEAHERTGETSENYEVPSMFSGSGCQKSEEQLPQLKSAESDKESQFEFDLPNSSNYFAVAEGREEPDFQGLSAIKMDQDFDCASMAPLVSLLNG